MPEMEKGRISEQERIVHRRMRKFPPNYSTNMAAKCARRLQKQNFQKTEEKLKKRLESLPDLEKCKSRVKVLEDENKNL